MSYRSFKRVLGETSLERKCRFLFGACLLLLITGSFWWYGRQTERLVHETNRNKGRLLVDTIMTLTHWEALALKSENEFEREFGKEVKDLSENLQREKFEWSVPWSYKSRSAQDQLLDGFERDAIQAFLRAAPPPSAPADAKQIPLDPEYEERIVRDRLEYQYFQPVRAQATCMQICHRPSPTTAGLDPSVAGAPLGGQGSVDGKPLAEGDVMAVVKVQIPYGPTLNEMSWNRAVLLSTAIITVFLAMIASYVIVRYVIVKPLKHLRDVSDEVSRGNTQLRADIHTGDEFEALAVAFNRMLRHLIDAQDELRHVNDDLDAKVDQLAQANMRLFDLNRMKSDFLATMSHELRTPLNAILGFSDVLGSIESLNDKQRRYVENIRKSGKVLLDMINDILDLAKIEAGRMELRLSEFNIEPIVHAQCDLVRALSEKKNIDLEVHVDTNLAALRQDQAKVSQILNNLLSNATKFTPEGGRIIVSASPATNGDLLLIVQDTGVGISEQDQKHIFEKFRQGEAVVRSGDALVREHSGTGLGLSIVKELCRLLGGEVTLHSELGKGSTFTVRLPWTLAEKPRLDSALAESFDELNRKGDLARRKGELRPWSEEPAPSVAEGTLP